jgi:hypothetical protein
MTEKVRKSKEDYEVYYVLYQVMYHPRTLDKIPGLQETTIWKEAIAVPAGTRQEEVREAWMSKSYYQYDASQVVDKRFLNLLREHDYLENQDEDERCLASVKYLGEFTAQEFHDYQIVERFMYDSEHDFHPEHLTITGYEEIFDKHDFAMMIDNEETCAEVLLNHNYVNRWMRDMGDEIYTTHEEFVSSLVDEVTTGIGWYARPYWDVILEVGFCHDEYYPQMYWYWNEELESSGLLHKVKSTLSEDNSGNITIKHDGNEFEQEFALDL